MSCSDLLAMEFRLLAHEPLSMGTRRLLRELGEQIIACPSAPDADHSTALHEARKSCKRARAVLRLVRDHLGDEVYARENQRFRDAARLLAGARDSWVMLSLVDRLVAEDDGLLEDASLVAFRAQLVERQRADGSRTAGGTDVWEMVEAMMGEGLAELHGRAQGSLGVQDLCRGVRRVYAQARHALRRSRVGQVPEHLHEWRKQVKYLWHQVEVLTEMWPQLLTPLAAELHLLADYLGDDHDLVVLRSVAVDARRELGGPPALQRLLEQIDDRRRVLAALAMPLGARMFTDPPAIVARRLVAWWDAWQLELEHEEQCRQLRGAYLRDQSPHERLLSTGEAALALHSTPARVRRLIGKGLLPATKVGRAWVIRSSDLP